MSTYEVATLSSLSTLPAEILAIINKFVTAIKRLIPFQRLVRERTRIRATNPGMYGDSIAETWYSFVDRITRNQQTATRNVEEARQMYPHMVRRFGL